MLRESVVIVSIPWKSLPEGAEYSLNREGPKPPRSKDRGYRLLSPFQAEPTKDQDGDWTFVSLLQLVGRCDTEGLHLAVKVAALEP